MASSLTAYDASLTKNASSCPPKLVAFHEIQNILNKLLSTKEGVDGILRSQLEAFQIASKRDKCANLPIQTAGQKPYPALAAGPGAQVCIKTGYAVDDSVMVSKCAAGGGDFAGNTGSVSVYDQKTLRHILKKYPPDELFQMSTKEISSACLSILRLQESKLLLGLYYKP